MLLVKPKRLELLYKGLYFRRICDFLGPLELGINCIVRHPISQLVDDIFIIVNEHKLRGESDSLKPVDSGTIRRGICPSFVLIGANAGLEKSEEPVLLYTDPRDIAHALKLLLKPILNTQAVYNSSLEG